MVAVSGPLSDLHRLSLSRESFAVCCPLTLLGNASYRVRVLTRRFASRFFQQYPHGRRLAVYSGRYDQLPGGLAPPSHDPFWAYNRRAKGLVLSSAPASQAPVE